MGIVRMLSTRNAAPALAEQALPDTLARLRGRDELVTPGLPLVSIITIVRNGEDTLERAIRSVRDQSYPSIEHILIDGASTDGTLDIIRRHLDWVAAWSTEPDGGLYDAMNRGIAASTGDIIGILNADDWFSPDLVENAVEALRRSNGDFVFGDIWMYGYRGQDHFLRGDPDYARVVRKDAPRTWHTTMLCKRVMYERVGLYRRDMRIASDYDWQIRAYRLGFRGVHCPDVVAHVAAGGISTTQQVVALKEGFVASVSNGYPLPLATAHWSWRWLTNRFPRLGQGAVRLGAWQRALRSRAATAIRPLWQRLGALRRFVPGKRLAKRLAGVAPAGPAAGPEPTARTGERLAAFVEARHVGDALSDRGLELLIDRSASWRHAVVRGRGTAADQLRALLVTAGVPEQSNGAAADLVAIFDAGASEAEAEAHRLGAVDMICECPRSEPNSVVLGSGRGEARICLRTVGAGHGRS